MITVEQRDPHDPISIALLAALNGELSARYDEDPVGAEIPDGVVGPRGAFVVAWLDGVPVGCGALRPTQFENTAEIKRMYVHPDTRGKGVAGHMLAKLESLAMAFGYARIILETGTRQPEAIRLYEKHGYQQMGCYGPYDHDPLSVCFQKMLN
jgi:GNAT superfamily N-acetyltransferase